MLSFNDTLSFSLFVYFPLQNHVWRVIERSPGNEPQKSETNSIEGFILLSCSLDILIYKHACDVENHTGKRMNVTLISN